MKEKDLSRFISTMAKFLRHQIMLRKEKVKLKMQLLIQMQTATDFLQKQNGNLLLVVEILNLKTGQKLTV